MTRKNRGNVYLFDRGKKPGQSRDSAPAHYGAENSCLPPVALIVFSSLIQDVEYLNTRPSGHEIMRLLGKIEAYCGLLREFQRNFETRQKQEAAAILTALHTETTNRKAREFLDGARYPFFS